MHETRRIPAGPILKPSVISLTFDDGMDSHLDRAAPLMKTAGVKGTFFVHTASTSFRDRPGDWRRLAADGHELGNHSVLHPATRHKAWVTEENAIENYSLDRMRAELEAANRSLSAIDGLDERPFAYPCDNRILGHPGWLTGIVRAIGLGRTSVAGRLWQSRWDLGSTLTDYECIVRDMFPAARYGTTTSDTDRTRYPSHRIPCVPCDHCSADQLNRIVNDAVQAGGWTVLMFHGIGGGHGLSCDEAAFASLIQNLSSDHRLTVQPFLSAARALCDRSSEGTLA